MVRTPLKNLINGWLIIDKPAGITSATSVNTLKRLIGAGKAGHAGTLDPEATGILAIAFGEATKTIQFVTDATKSYLFNVTLGTSTDTDDSSGRVIQTSKKRPSDNQIISVLPSFVGMIQQIPPRVSAIKVNGHRAYKLHREGKPIKLKSREIFVENLIFKNRISNNEVELEMICGKGGYVRSIARDLGELLGCYAHVKKIRRTSSASFNISDACTWHDLLDMKPIQIIDRLLPTSTALMQIPQIKCTESEMTRLLNGNSILLNSTHENSNLVWVSFGDQPIAIGCYYDKRFQPSRIFNFKNSLK